MRRWLNSLNHPDHLFKKKKSEPSRAQNGWIYDLWSSRFIASLLLRGWELFNKSPAVNGKMLLANFYRVEASPLFKSPWQCDASHAFYSCCWGAKTVLTGKTRRIASLRRWKLKFVSKYLVLQIDGKIWLQPLVLNPISQSEVHSRGEKLSRRRHKKKFAKLQDSIPR